MRPMLVCIILLAALSSARAETLPRAGGCGGCHTQSYEGYLSSAHARSISTEAFRTGLKRYLLKEGTDSGGYCFRCHAPGVFISGGVFEFTKTVLKGRPGGEGVTCVACHSVEAVKDGKAVFDPGESPGYHRVKDLRYIDKEELCTICHSSYKKAIAEPVKAEKKGLLGRAASRFGQVLGTKTYKEIDHTFSDTIVTGEEHGRCPAESYMEGNY